VNVAKQDIPKVEDTDLTRDEMEEVAEELDVAAEGLDDQALLEQLGVALGAVDADAVPSSSASGGTQGAEEVDDGDDDEEQDAGQRFEDMTRAELRDELRERDLPVSGNKSALVERLVEAEQARS
jgi:hypothetical protein